MVVVAYFSPLELTMLGLLAIWASAIVVLLAWVRRRARWQECRYRVFAVRDAMVRLVVDGRLDRDSTLYHETVPAMNALIRMVPNYTVSAVAQGLVEVDGTSRAQDSLSAYREALDLADDDVVRAIDEFWAITLMTLKDNSPSLRVYLWLRTHAESAARLIGDVTRSFGRPTSWRAYQVGLVHRSLLSHRLEAAHT